jgi:hypothetical protein
VIVVGVVSCSALCYNCGRNSPQRGDVLNGKTK